MDDQWFLSVGGKESGPLTAAQLKAMAGLGRFGLDDLVRRGQSEPWMKANQVRGLFGVAATPRPSLSLPVSEPAFPTIQASDAINKPMRRATIKLGTYRRTVRRAAMIGVILAAVVVLTALIVFKDRAFAYFRTPKSVARDKGLIRRPITDTPNDPIHESDDKRRRVQGNPDEPDHTAADPSQATVAHTTTQQVSPSVKVLDVVDVMKAAGFSIPDNYAALQYHLRLSLEGYVRYATAQAYEKARGQILLAQAAEEAADEHRRQLRKQTYILGKQSIKVHERSDFSQKGLLVVIKFPIRLHWQTGHDKWGGDHGDNINDVNLYCADDSETWFLTKDQQLMKCNNAAEAAMVARNDGILYFPESLTTDIVLFLGVDRNKAIEISKKQFACSAEVIFSDLQYETEFDWGFYKREALIENDWESDRLFLWNATGTVLPGTPPDYFRPIRQMQPKVVSAIFDAVRVRDESGNVIATFPQSQGWSRFVLPANEGAAAREDNLSLAGKRNQTPRATAKSRKVIPGKVITNSVGMKIVSIPAGEFTMGSPVEEVGRTGYEKERVSTITESFSIGVYDVTQSEYRQVVGDNPSYFAQSGEGRAKVAGQDTDRFPVEQVSWLGAVKFCNKLSEKEGLPEYYRVLGKDVSESGGQGYRLPTEAEWEYACRAGTETAFSFGSTLNGQEANCDGTHPYGDAIPGPHLSRTTRVGSYSPNAFGLYDMHGNVCEWCQDSRSATRAIRGGSWSSPASNCRSASRDGYSASSRNPPHRIGFRCVRRKLLLDNANAQDADRSTPRQRDNSGEGKPASIVTVDRSVSASAQIPQPAPTGNDAFSGVWKSDGGIVLRLADDGSDVSLNLVSKVGIFQSLEGVLSRTGEKWQAKDILKGTLTAVFANDPLSRGGKANKRTLAVRRMFFKDDTTLRLITEKVSWNKAGKETQRQTEMVDLTRDESAQVAVAPATPQAEEPMPNAAMPGSSVQVGSAFKLAHVQSFNHPTLNLTPQPDKVGLVKKESSSLLRVHMDFQGKGTIAFEASDKPGWYLVQSDVSRRGGKVRFQEFSNTAEFKNAASFVIVKPLGTKDGQFVSFQSSLYPELYLSHWGWVFDVRQVRGDEIARNSTFRIIDNPK